MTRWIICLAMLYPTGWTPASAQSLVEVAKKEKQRRADLKAHKEGSLPDPGLKRQGVLEEAPKVQTTPNPKEEASHQPMEAVEPTSEPVEHTPKEIALVASLGAGEKEIHTPAPVALDTEPLEIPVVETAQQPARSAIAWRADDAYDNEDYALALELYEDVLEQEPGNQKALYRAARLLSWEKRYSESIVRYDQLLAVTPGNRSASVEKANVLLWDGQHGRAAEIFQGQLLVYPNDRDAQLGLARSLAGGQKLDEARAAYEQVLVNNPTDTEAMLGVAQTYHWSGASELAREWYEKALEQDPTNRDAQVGLGYLDLWSDPVAARARSSWLSYRYPDNEDVRKLREASLQARAPSAGVSYDRMGDTHGNNLDITRLEGGVPLTSRLDLTVGGARYGMKFTGDFGGRPGSGSADSVYSILGFPSGGGQALAIRVGVTRLNETLGGSHTVAIGGVGWNYGQGRRWQVNLSANRDPFLYTTESLDRGIIVNSFSAGVTRWFTDHWFAEGEVGYWDISDKMSQDNSRTSFSAGAGYRTSLTRRFSLEAGYDFQSFKYAQNWGASFFSPSFYRSHRGRLLVSGNLGSRIDFHAGLDVGAQSFDYVSNEPMFLGQVVIGIPIATNYRFEFFGMRGDYLLLSNLPVVSDQIGVRFRWKGGAR